MAKRSDRGGRGAGNGANPDPSVISTNDNDRALAERNGGGAPPATADDEHRERLEDQFEPEGDAPSGHPDDFDPADLDDTPHLGDPRGEPKPLDMSRETYPMGGGHGAASHAVRHEVSALTRKLRGLGPTIACRFQRLKPTDLPDAEYGWTPWETIPANQPTEDDLEELIEKRHGGGTYEVALRSATDKGLVLGEMPRVVLFGQWKPQTPTGIETYRLRFGIEPPAPSARPAGDPSLGPTPEDARKLDVAGQLIGKAMEMSQRASELRANDGIASKTGENALVLELVRGRGGGDSNILALMMQQQTALQTAAMTAKIEADKLALERERMMREEARKDREWMLTMVRPAGGTGDPSLQAANLAAIEIVKQAASDERGLKMEVLKASLKGILANNGFDSNEQETWSEFFQGMLKDGLGALPAVIPQLAAAFRDRRSRRGNGLPPGYVADENGVLYPAAIAPQHLLPAGRPAVAPAPPRGLPRPPAPQPTAAHAGAVVQPTGAVPPTGAALPPPPAAAPPRPAGTPEGAPAAESHAGTEAALPDVDEAFLNQLDVLMAFGYYVAKPDNLRPAWKGFWELVPRDGNGSIEDSLDRSPKAFREAMQRVGLALDKVDAGDPPTPATAIAFSAWVGETPLEEARAAATKLDEALVQDPTAHEWVKKMILDGPWEDEGDPAGDDDDRDDDGENWRRGGRRD